MDSLWVLFLWIGFCYVVGTTACPRGCRCMKEGKENLAICLSTNFTTIPDDIPANTNQLILKNNQIKILQQGAFNRFGSLSSLGLTHCEIEIIEPNAFTGLGNLAFLDLQNNKIKELQPYAFSGLFALKRLLLENNHLSEIQNFAFNGLNLTLLGLRKNPDLTDISMKAFQGARISELLIFNSSLNDRSLDSLRPLTETLRELSWEHNRIPLSIPRNLFSGFHFHLLKLNDNGIRETLFLEHVVTDELSLEGNPTGPINFSHYPYLQQLRQLHLGRMNFRRVDGQYFTNMPQLTLLDLNRNGIMTLPSNLQPIFNKLTRLIIEDNNIYCNCELVWFKRWLVSSGIYVGGATCNHPFVEDMLYVDESSMTCIPPKITSITQNRNVSVSEELSLTCTAKGDPAPTISWKWPNGEVTIIAPSIDRNLTENKGRLHIRSAQPHDQGLYRCNAYNPVGNVSAATEVLVYRVTYDPRVGSLSLANHYICNLLLLAICLFQQIM